jgi:hypothetical protein
MHWQIRNPLPQPLMGSGLIEVDNIPFKKPGELFLMENQEMIQAFSPHASQKAFADGICLRSSVWRSKYFDTACGRHACEIRTEFPVVIPNQISWCVSIRSRFPQLLRDPGIGRGSCHIHMDDLPRLQLDDEEGKERTEEKGQGGGGNHMPTPLPHECGGTFSSSVHPAVFDERAAYTSESSVYSPEYPA